MEEEGEGGRRDEEHLLVKPVAIIEEVAESLVVDLDVGDLNAAQPSEKNEGERERERERRSSSTCIPSPSPSLPSLPRRSSRRLGG